MRAQTPVGVSPASKTVRRTIEVAVLRGTLENCTLDCMRRANLHKGFLQLNFPPLSPGKKFGGTIPKRSEQIGLFVPRLQLLCHLLRSSNRLNHYHLPHHGALHRRHLTSELV